MIFKIFNDKHVLDKIVYKKTDEWHIKRERVVHQLTTSGTTSDNE